MHITITEQEYQELMRVKREYFRLQNLHKNLALVNKQLKLALDAIQNKAIDCEIRSLIEFINYAVNIIEKEAKLEELLK